MATTRPETILGDTAVAVHPEDERYRHLIGRTCLVPILKRAIPVIHDTYVDREFGTGALKITPGHDPADYEIGQRHGLPIVNVLNPDATMNEKAGPYAGLDRFECRKRLWADMEAAGLTIKTEPYTMQVPRSPARRRDRRAAGLHPVVREDEAAGRAGAGGRARRRHPHRARALHQGLLQLAGEHPRLVHLAPAVVGAPHPGLVLRRRAAR